MLMTALDTFRLFTHDPTLRLVVDAVVLGTLHSPVPLPNVA